eukprot:15334396-Ditylum_brightwellii.AAC.1
MPSAILFVHDKESTANINKVKITLKFSLTVPSNKNNITKKLAPKLKYGSPEEGCFLRARFCNTGGSSSLKP